MKIINMIQGDRNRTSIVGDPANLCLVFSFLPNPSGWNRTKKTWPVWTKASSFGCFRIWSCAGHKTKQLHQRSPSVISGEQHHKEAAHKVSCSVQNSTTAIGEETWQKVEIARVSLRTVTISNMLRVIFCGAAGVLAAAAAAIDLIMLSIMMMVWSVMMINKAQRMFCLESKYW